MESQSPAELAKAPTAIPGFDALAAGGLPRARTTLLLGGPGTGKTVFALQTLVNGARELNEPGILVAFEESAAEIRSNACSFAWELAALERDGLLYLLDAQLPMGTVRSGEFDLQGTLAALTAKVKEMGAKRIVFDSVDVLLALFAEPEAANQELRRIRRWLTDNTLTGLITARFEAIEEEATLRYPFLLFLADCVVLLHYRVSERMALRELRILKYRGSCFEQNEYPFTIGAEGIEVGDFGLSKANYPVFSERVSSGIGRLDTMLGGGYFRGSSVLVTGSPGTAKTTLAGAFAQATGRRKERTLYIAFDETSQEIGRDLASVNIRLSPFLETGLLQVHAFYTESRSVEEHLIRIKALIDGYQPHALVVDPLSALVHAGGRMVALAVAQRLLAFVKSRGITLLATSLLASADPTAEGSLIRVSTIADTWLHLAYVVSAGERNRTLSVVKARGIGHSNQVRELVLGSGGVTLADVYTAGGAVIMGTLRAEREAAEYAGQERQRAEVDHHRRELQAAEAEANARLSALERELEAKRATLDREVEVQRAQLQRELEVRRVELERLEQEEQLRQHLAAQRRQTVRRLRRTDVTEPAARPSQDLSREPPGRSE